jgi:hypothetical protein
MVKGGSIIIWINGLKIHQFYLYTTLKLIYLPLVIN